MNNMSLVSWSPETPGMIEVAREGGISNGKLDLNPAPSSLFFSAMVQAIDTAYRLNKENKNNPESSLEEILNKINDMRPHEINKTDSEGNTLLHIAFDKDKEIYPEYPRQGNPLLLPIVQALLEKDIEVGMQNRQGRTALHQACESRAQDLATIVELLIERGANLHIKDNEDNLPIHIICANKKGSSLTVMARIKKLLAHHSGINAKNLAGKVPIQIAHENKRDDVVNLLLNRGAKIPPDLLREMPEASAKQIAAPSEEALAEERCHDLPLCWYDAASKGIKSEQCAQLYQETAHVVQDLNKPKHWRSSELDKIKRQIIEGGFCRSEEQNKQLAQWIVQNTKKNLDGPYRPINDLFYCVKYKEMPLPLKNMLQQIDDKIECLFGIVFNLPSKLPKEVEMNLLSSLHVKTLLALRLASKHCRDRATEALAEKIVDLRFPKRKMIEFFGPHSHLLQHFSSRLLFADVDDPYLQKIVSMVPNIKIVTLHKINITQEGTQYFATLASLKELIITKPKLDDFTFLQKCKALSKFQLEKYCKQTLDLNCLTACEGLNDLIIKDSEITLLNLSQKLENLKRISLTNCSRLRDFEFLQHCVNLRHLVIDNSQVTAADLNILQYCPNLKFLQIVNCPGLQDVSWLQHCSNLEGLVLEQLNNEEVISNLNALQHCKKLKSLLIIKQKIRDLTFLPNSSILEILVIKGVAQFAPFSPPPLVEGHPMQFKRWENLKEVMLENVLITDLSFLERCKQIVTFSLKNCASQIGSFESLQNCQNLKTFALTYDSNCANDMRDLSSLGNCEQLKILNLSGCLFKDISFANDLKNLGTLLLNKAAWWKGDIEDQKRFEKFDMTEAMAIMVDQGGRVFFQKR